MWNTTQSVNQRVTFVFLSRPSLIKQLECAKFKIKLAQIRQMHIGQAEMGVREGWLYRDNLIGVFCIGLRCSCKKHEKQSARHNLATDTDQAFPACADLVFQGSFVQHRNCVGEGLVGGAIYACNSAGGQQMMQLARPLLKPGHSSLLFLLFDSAAVNTHFIGHSETLSWMLF